MPKEQKVTLKKRYFYAFSLIEIMVGLIVMSAMVAAFAPVITKKIQNSSVALTQQDAVNTKSIRYKVFNYDAGMNGRDGCVISGSYLQCPFEVPEGVDKINAVVVGGGGGGGGSLANQSDAKTASVTNGNTTSVTITKFTKNVKVPYLVGGGGGGGGGYYYYNHVHKDAVENAPSSQADCDAIAGSGKSYYTNANSCITSSNLTGTSVSGASISYHVAGTAYNTTPSSKICWTGNTGYSGSSEKDTNPDASYHYTSHTWGTTAAAYPVCTYDAAVEICSKYGSGSYVGKWHVPSDSEVNYIALNHSYKVYPLGKGSKYTKWTISPSCSHTNHAVYSPARIICDPGAIDAATVYVNRDRDTKCNSSSVSGLASKDTPEGLSNLCLANYVWTSGMSYRDQGFNGATLTSYYESYTGFKPTGADKYTCIWIYPSGTPNFTNKGYSALSVRCSISWKSTTPASDTYSYKQASGGGGSSGSYVSNITIPDSVIANNVGGKIEIKAGAGGSAGSKSASSAAATTHGTAGGASYVYVRNTAGTVVYGVEVSGGDYGYGGSDSGNLYGGYNTSTYSYYKVNTGSGWSDKKTSVASPIGGFTAGASGGNGSRVTTSATVNGGAGGASRYGSYGAGGSGGGAYANGAYSGSAGSPGYAYLTYNEVYAGAPGGGGGGARLIKVKEIDVTEGQKLYIRVGKGGAAGASAAGAAGGESAFCKTNACNSGFYYRALGGSAGGAGTRQQANGTGPTAGGAGAAGGVSKTGTTTTIDKAGNAGSAGTVTAGTLRGTGGNGGHSGINTYLIGLDANNYVNLSTACGGYNGTNSKASTYHCSNGSTHNASYNGDLFSNPGKIYRDDSVKFGSAGSGGAGGGVDPSSSTAGTATAGQDGYVYLWWEEYE